MSEMEYEPVPEVYVPVVRWWWGRAATSWSNALWPRSGWMVWGCLFVVVWFFWVLLKFYLWVGILAVMLALQVVTALYDLASYRWRKRQAISDAMHDYAGEIYRTEHPREEYPPDLAG